MDRERISVLDQLPKTPETSLQVQLEATERLDTAYKFLKAMRILIHRQLFITEEGLCSSTKFGVKPGDIFVAFNGSTILHLLRKMINPTDNGLETWRLVGYAYLQPPSYGSSDELCSEQSDAEEREFVLA